MWNFMFVLWLPLVSWFKKTAVHGWKVKNQTFTLQKTLQMHQLPSRQNETKFQHVCLNSDLTTRTASTPKPALNKPVPLQNTDRITSVSVSNQSSVHLSQCPISEFDDPSVQLPLPPALPSQWVLLPHSSPWGMAGIAHSRVLVTGPGKATSTIQVSIMQHVLC